MTVTVTVTGFAPDALVLTWWSFVCLFVCFCICVVLAGCVGAW